MLFLGISITMISAVTLIKTQEGNRLYTMKPFYFITGIFSAILDNALTLLTRHSEATVIDSKSPVVTHVPKVANTIPPQWQEFFSYLMPLGNALNLLVLLSLQSWIRGTTFFRNVLRVCF